ncbi:hypothetical protein [Flexivirga alba]|uniref:DoxX family membrane protein n=1 Tax=Flexivirga alba TaxID=702742 RepID=A0ABW2ALD2_9MICO
MKIGMTGDRLVGWCLRLLVAACLVADGVVHLRLASRYALASAPGHLSEGLLFRVESVAALVVALLVLVLGSRAAYAAAFVVAGSAFIAVMLFRYVAVPAFGPVPSMYEPIWFRDKSISAVAEGLGAVLSAAGFVRAWVVVNRGQHRIRR